MKETTEIKMFANGKWKMENGNDISLEEWDEKKNCS